MHSAFLQLEQVLPLRSKVLRNGGDYTSCTFPSDQLPGVFHAGILDETGTVLCILSCHPQAKAPLQGVVYQLRGMATEPACQGQGLGKMLVGFAIQHIKALGGTGIWCNARKNACVFYSRLGFEFMSEEFEISGIGPHRVMGISWEKASAI